MALISLTVNGVPRTVEASPETPLLWALRDQLQLKGTKYGCGAGMCGCCTVHLDGRAVRACSTALSEADGRTILTVEGLAQDPAHAGLFRAWLAEEVSQCGYCQPGHLMTAAALLASNPRPTDPQIDEAFAASLCRCGTYTRIRRAIHRAAEEATR